MGKLTVSVDDEAIRAAKQWAKAHGLSVSQMVSTFFFSLTKYKQPPDKMPAKLRKLAGVLNKDDASIKKYHDHIKSKDL